MTRKYSTTIIEDFMLESRWKAITDVYSNSTLSD
jgi:hypothetical protein